VCGGGVDPPDHAVRLATVAASTVWRQACSQQDCCPDPLSPHAIRRIEKKSERVVVAREGMHGMRVGGDGTGVQPCPCVERHSGTAQGSAPGGFAHTQPHSTPFFVHTQDHPFHQHRTEPKTADSVVPLGLPFAGRVLQVQTVPPGPAESMPTRTRTSNNQRKY
jgi:hypothetical protein